MVSAFDLLDPDSDYEATLGDSTYTLPTAIDSSSTSLSTKKLKLKQKQHKADKKKLEGGIQRKKDQSLGEQVKRNNDEKKMEKYPLRLFDQLHPGFTANCKEEMHSVAKKTDQG